MNETYPSLCPIWLRRYSLQGMRRLRQLFSAGPNELSVVGCFNRAFKFN